MIGAIIFLVLLAATVASIAISVQKKKAEQPEAEELVIDKPVVAPDPIVEVKPTKAKTTKKATTKTKNKK